MPSKPLLLFLFIAPSLIGCSTTQRFGNDAALGAGAGLLGHELSHGDPAITAAAAVGGVALGEGLNALRSAQNKKAFAKGYTQGRADGVKSIYWDLVDQHKPTP